jgi:PKD repeat protein
VLLRLLVSALALALPAQAVAQSTVGFGISPDPAMEDGVTAFSFQGPSAFQNGDVEWDLNGNGTYETSGRSVSRTYTSPGQVTVRMRANRDGDGVPAVVVTKTITVRVDPGPAASFGFAPAVPLPAQEVTLTSTSQPSQGAIAAGDWDLDGDGAFDDAQGTVARTSFAAPGTHRVRLRVRQTNGKTAVRELDVRVNAAPAAAFAWSPAAPLAGQFVDLVSTSADAEGALTLSWDLDGDGLFGDAAGAKVRQPFSSPGTYDVGLRATDSDGAVSTVRHRVVVLAAPVIAPAGPAQPAAPAPRPMNPFPVVRIAGVVLRRGALIRVLSVRAPRGAQVRVVCRGKGCPARALATTTATRLARFARFERRLRAGVRLELFVRRAGRIGKYTRFLIRGGAPPKRVDRCLFPGSRRPERCP